MEEEIMGKTGLQKTTEVMKATMNRTTIWVDSRNIILFRFYEKPMASNMVIHKWSDMPGNNRMSSLNQEMIRRMLNTIKDLSQEDRVRVVDDYSQKLINSDYSADQTRTAITGG